MSHAFSGKNKNFFYDNIISRGIEEDQRKFTPLMFNLNKKKQKTNFCYCICSSSGSYTFEKKLKTNYYTKKISGKLWVSL